MTRQWTMRVLLLAACSGLAAASAAQSGAEAVAVLVERTKDRRASVRQGALEELTRIDLADDGVVNRDAVVQAALTAIGPGEMNEDVVDEALLTLQKVDPAKATPGMVQALMTRLQDGHDRAAVVLGRIKAREAVPALEAAAASPDKGFAAAAKLALARLGDQRYLSEIAAELGGEGSASRRAFEKLAYIEDEATVRWIAPFLYHSGGPAPVIGPRDRVGYGLYRQMAAWALGQIVRDPPVRKAEMWRVTDQDVEAWKAWWTANQDRY